MSQKFWSYQRQKLGNILTEELLSVSFGNSPWWALLMVEVGEEQGWRSLEKSGRDS